MIPADPRALIASVHLNRRALAAFNVNNLETVQAVIAAADDLRAPVIVQISPGAIAYAGYDAIVAIARREASRAVVPVLVHLDHCRDADLVRRAIRDGFSSVMYDGSHLPLVENVEATAGLVRVAHEQGVAVEAEVGVIGGSEAMSLDDARRGITTPDEAARFVDATNVDILAPAMGSLHRMPNDSVRLDVEGLSALAEAARRPLALHGGSGVDQSQLMDIIRVGVGKVNISSRIGRAFAAGIAGVWAKDAEALDIRRYLGAGRDQVRALATEYLRLCGATTESDAAPPVKWTGSITEPE